MTQCLKSITLWVCGAGDAAGCWPVCFFLTLFICCQRLSLFPGSFFKETSE